MIDIIRQFEGIYANAMFSDERNAETILIE